MFKPRAFPPKLAKNIDKQMTIAEIYPELTLEQQEEAEFFLLRYLEIVRRIFERTRRA
jgi:hypothetical protein